MLSSRNEQGSILLYTVITVTFMAGLGLYLQKMSDPMLFQTNDTKRLLTEEYLVSSSSLLLSEIIYNDQYLPQCNNDTSAKFRTEFAKTMNRYKYIYLFSNKTSLLSSITRVGTFSATQVNSDQTGDDICANSHVYEKQEYTIRPYIGKSVTKKVDINIYF